MKRETRNKKTLPVKTGKRVAASAGNTSDMASGIVARNKTECKAKRPYWTLRRVAVNLGKDPGHLSRVLRGTRKSSALLNLCIAVTGFDRFAEMASPEVVKSYVSKTY